MKLSETVEKISLIPLDELTSQQAIDLLAIRNAEDVRNNMYTTHIISLDEHMKWIADAKKSQFIKFYAVTIDQKIIGGASISAINAANKRADWAYYIDPEVQGKGTGAALEFKFINFIFENLGIEKLNCEVLDFNEKVVSLHKKFGFIEEGKRRDHIIRGDRKHDIYLLGLTRNEWIEKREELKKRLFA